MKTLLLLVCFLSSLAFSATETVLLPQSLVAANNGGQADIDLSKYKGPVDFYLMTHKIAGTNPTLACKIQTSSPAVIGNSVMTGTTAGLALRTDTAVAVKLAASFTIAAGSTPSIKTTVLPLLKHATLTAGTLTLGIYADSSGPTGSALQTATADVATLTAAYTGVTFTYAKPATLAASTKYWLVLTSDYTANATANVTWRKSTVGSAGNSSQYDTGWTAGTTTSLNYKNYQYQFSDLTGGGFTGVTTVSTIQNLNLNLQNAGILRLFVAIGGTDSPEYIVGLAARVNE